MTLSDLERVALNGVMTDTPALVQSNSFELYVCVRCIAAAT